MIPIGYTFRNIIQHKITSALTILGIALVVFVFCSSMMLTNGLEETMVASGSDDNVTVIRQASQSEVQSIIMYDQARVISAFPEIVQDDDGSPLFANEVYVLITLKKLESGEEGNVSVRGITDKSMKLRPELRINL